MSLLKCAWRLNFTFVEIFLLFFKIGRKPLFLNLFRTIKNSDFEIFRRNIKKFQKNVKFSLQAHFNINILLSGSDQLFGL